MSVLPDAKDLHSRAAQSAKETRGTLTTLCTAALGAMIFVVTQKIEPQLSHPDRIAVLVTIVLMVVSLGSAIWFGYSDAQWSYQWGVELDQTRSPDEIVEAIVKKGFWHAHKNWSERLMLLSFFLASVSGAVFVLSRTFAWK